MTELTPATATRYSAVFQLGDESDSYIVEPKDHDGSTGPLLVLGGSVVEFAVRTRGRYANTGELEWVDNLVGTLRDWREAIVEPTAELSTVEREG